MKELDKTAQSAVREIQRKLQPMIRDDWEFPDPHPSPALEHADPGIAAEEEKRPTSSGGVGEKRQMRERYYGTTDDSSDEEAEMIEEIYAFDSPDTVGEEVDKKAKGRRKRKRREMEDELRWNPGLCFFVRRRNAWTGAVERPGRRYSSETKEKRPKLATSSDSSPVRTPTSAASATAALDEAMEGIENTSSTTQQHQFTMNEWIPPSHAPAFAPPAHPEDLTYILIPLAPPLVPPSNPVRISLSSRSASELYTKIVRDSRTPAIPVNLSDMTRIIVQGWKDEGNWPPKGTGTVMDVVRPGTADGRTRVARAIGVRGEEGGFISHHPHLQRGVEGVKRVFRLSGSGEGLKSPKSPTGGKGKMEDAFRSH